MSLVLLSELPNGKWMDMKRKWKEMKGKWMEMKGKWMEMKGKWMEMKGKWMEMNGFRNIFLTKNWKFGYPKKIGVLYCGGVYYWILEKWRTLLRTGLLKLFEH